MLVAVLAMIRPESSRGSSIATPVYLHRVSGGRLQSAGIALLQPAPNQQPHISRKAAASFALALFPLAPGNMVREEVLARVRLGSQPASSTERLCWVVDITPTSGIIPHSGGSQGGGPAALLHPDPDAFFLVFVDAENGRLFFAGTG